MTYLGMAALQTQSQKICNTVYIFRLTCTVEKAKSLWGRHCIGVNRFEVFSKGNYKPKYSIIIFYCTWLMSSFWGQIRSIFDNKHVSISSTISIKTCITFNLALFLVEFCPLKFYTTNQTESYCFGKAKLLKGGRILSWLWTP